MMIHKRNTWRRGVLLGLVLTAGMWAHATQIRDLCEVQGARGNHLKGIGIVVGLAGTGDKTTAAIRAQERMLDRLEIDVAQASDLKSDNCAVVVVDATIPAFAKEGTRIDVRVNSIYDCQSLEGGTLLDTQLMGNDGNVYAVAQGPISVGGFNADGGGGTSIQKNHVTAGRLPMGAYVEREIPATITDGERIMLLLKRPDFGTASELQDAINMYIGTGTASALGAGTICVTIPDSDQRDLVGFIARVQDLEVETRTPAKVVINERTGTLVVGGMVVIKPCQVAHGSLTIQISSQAMVSQPLPFSGGMTAVVPDTSITADEEPAYLMPIEGTSAADVAAALNKLKVTPRDMISIFQALREAGALEADLEIM